MKCKTCGSTFIEYDQLSEMYYCHECNKLYDEKDIDLSDEVQVSDDFEEEESEETYKDLGSGEDLNGFSLIVLHFLMTIPILNIVGVSIASSTEVKEEYKKSFAYRFISQLIILFSLMLFWILYANNYADQINTVVTNGLHSAASVMTPIVKEYKEVSHIPEMTSIDVITEVVDEAKEEEVEDVETDFKVLTYAELSYLDGAYFTGEQAQDFIEDHEDDYQLGYLIQTESMVDRYDEESYRAIGYLLSGSEKKDSSGKTVYFNTKQDVYSYYLNDYGELMTVPTSDVTNKRYIYYLNPDKFYEVTLLVDEVENIIGLAFEEAY